MDVIPDNSITGFRIPTSVDKSSIQVRNRAVSTNTIYCDVYFIVCSSYEQFCLQICSTMQVSEVFWWKSRSPGSLWWEWIGCIIITPSNKLRSAGNFAIFFGVYWHRWKSIPSTYSWNTKHCKLFCNAASKQQFWLYLRPRYLYIYSSAGWIVIISCINVSIISNWTAMIYISCWPTEALIESIRTFALHKYDVDPAVTGVIGLSIKVCEHNLALAVYNSIFPPNLPPWAKICHESCAESPPTAVVSSS